MYHSVNTNQGQMIPTNRYGNFRDSRNGGYGRHIRSAREARFGRNGPNIQNSQYAQHGSFIQDNGNNNFSNGQAYHYSSIPKRSEKYGNKWSGKRPSSFCKNDDDEPMQKRMRASEYNLPNEVNPSTFNEMQIKHEYELPNILNESSNSTNRGNSSFNCNSNSKLEDVTSLVQKLEFHGLIAKPKPKEDIKPMFEKQWAELREEKIPALSFPVVPDGSPPLCPKCQDNFIEYYSDLDDCLHLSGVIEEDGDYFHINCHRDYMIIKRMQKNNPNFDDSCKEIRGYESLKPTHRYYY